MAAVYYHLGRFPPDERLDWPKLVPFIGPVTAAVARYDGMLAAIPNPSVLLAVSCDDDWTGWCRFFLQAVQAQAEDNLTRAQGIIDLYDSIKRRVDELTRSRYAIRALDWMFERPIFRSSDFVTTAEIPEPTARRVLKLLIEDGILVVLWSGRGRRSSIICFSELLSIAEGRQTP